MRAHRLCLIGFAAATSVLTLDPAMAQMKLAPKTATPTNETRYFTSIDGLMDGNADVVLKETRQGKAVTSATLDVCYPAEKGSERKDRFVANLTASGSTLTGTAQTQVDKLPVSVRLTRKPTGDTFEFKGQITVGQTNNDVTSSDNSDQSEREFQENQSSDDNISATPKDFTEVSPEAVAVKIKVEAALDFVKSLRGQNVEVSLSSLNVACESLRSGEQVLVLGVDPERAAAFVSKAKAYPGVVNAGWTSGVVDMDRTIRFPAADWRDGDKLNRDKIAIAIAGVLAKTLSAKVVATKWSDDTGKLKLTFKRPSPALPALQLTDTIEVIALVAGDRPSGSDRLMLWIGAPSVATADESTGEKLNLADAGSADEEGDVRDDNGAVAALAAAFKAQRWDADKSNWK
ncbi:hypothetical protein BH11PSE4_BH11PSE4_04750 [soil metagenome]